MTYTRQQALQQPEPIEFEVQCPECGSKMRLRTSRHGLFYGCSTFPRCKATHGAHPDGEPLGYPADKETKQWRIRAHQEFDKLWRPDGSPFTRTGAYQWMVDTLALPPEEAHIGKFSIVLCQRLIAALEVRSQLEEINGRPDRGAISERRREKKRAAREKEFRRRMRGGRPNE